MVFGKDTLLAPAVLTLLPLRLLKQSARAWPLLRDLPAVALSSALKMLKRRSRTKLGRRSFWSVWKPAPKISSACRFLRGILTVRGGMTSHAAVVARGMGTCCVSGCGNENQDAIDYDAKVITINGHTFHEGDWMSIDGSTGNIYEGQIATVASTENANFKRFMSWARRSTPDEGYDQRR